MLSVIDTGGKQYLVKTGDTIKVEKLNKDKAAIAAGSNFVFDKVLLTADDNGQNVKVGTPFLAGINVTALITKQGKYPTVRVEKFKRKVRYHKVHGQRQRYTEVTIA